MLQPDLPSQLEPFFTNPTNSLGRASLLMHRLIHDLQMAAAHAGYYLRAYMVDVDNQGYDLVLDSTQQIRKYQVKTVLRSARTADWQITAGILKPTVDELNDVSLWQAAAPGLGGGLIVMEFELRDGMVHPSYGYTDLDLITLMSLGWIGKPNQQESARQALRSVLTNPFAAKTQIKRTMLVRPRDAECLLDLARIRCRKQTSWRHLFRTKFGGLTASQGLPPEQSLRSLVFDELACLVQSSEF